MTQFIVTARNVYTGRKVYYTGRAGSGFISENRADAFTYENASAANRRANIFSRNGAGGRSLVWMSDYADSQDAHNAGAAAMSEEMCG